MPSIHEPRGLARGLHASWLLTLSLTLFGCPAQSTRSPSLPAQSSQQTPKKPEYRVDPLWPKPLPNGWILGQVSGIAVDARDHVWVLHRPRTITDGERAAGQTPPQVVCGICAPPVLQFDRDGNLLSSWGGPAAGYEWPLNEHGIHVDAQLHVWIAGNDKADHQILEFQGSGQFLRQIGRAGQTGGSNDHELLGRPAHMEVDSVHDELWVADGYLNRRVVVFDATSGVYKRHFGAYGRVPDDAPLAPYRAGQTPSAQFGNPHCVRLARDGLVYVCDRSNDRIQVFTREGAFVKELFVAPQTLGAGSVWDLALSRDPAQAYLHVVDGTNNQLWTLLRSTGAVVAVFGRSGRSAGQFQAVHNLAIDSQGSLYTAEVASGRRVQKFDLLGRALGSK